MAILRESNPFLIVGHLWPTGDIEVHVLTDKPFFVDSQRKLTESIAALQAAARIAYDMRVELEEEKRRGASKVMAVPESRESVLERYGREEDPDGL